MGVLQRHNLTVSMVRQFIDAGIVAFLLPLLLYFDGIRFGEEYFSADLIAVFLSLVCFRVAGIYKPKRTTGLLSNTQLIMTVWGVVVILLLVAGWATKLTDFYSREVMGTWFVLTPLFLVGAEIGIRMLMRELREKGYNSRTAVVIGTGKLGQQLTDNLLESHWFGIRLLGMFSESPEEVQAKPSVAPILGGLDQVVGFVKAKKVDMVYLALPVEMKNTIIQLCEELQDTTASVYLVPDTFVSNLLEVQTDQLNGMPVISLAETPFYGPYGVVKRLEDIVVASLVLLLISPLMLVIASAIRLSSPGPVIFKQHRYGLNGAPVVIWKFRSMSVCENGADVVQTQRNDVRVTRIGSFLRKSSLDELPQFINVLQGRMSVVGPRPHAVAHNEKYRKLIKGYMMRHKVKPGITGWAQVNGWRGETDTVDKMEKRVEFDLQYIRNWSIALDLKIILLTILRGFGGKHVY